MPMGVNPTTKPIKTVTPRPGTGKPSKLEVAQVNLNKALTTLNLATKRVQTDANAILQSRRLEEAKVSAIDALTAKVRKAADSLR